MIIDIWMKSRCLKAHQTKTLASQKSDLIVQYHAARRITEISYSAIRSDLKMITGFLCVVSVRRLAKLWDNEFREIIFYNDPPPNARKGGSIFYTSMKSLQKRGSNIYNSKKYRGQNSTSLKMGGRNSTCWKIGVKILQCLKKRGQYSTSDPKSRGQNST